MVSGGTCSVAPPMRTSIGAYSAIAGCDNLARKDSSSSSSHSQPVSRKLLAASFRYIPTATMKSLRRDLSSNPQASNVASKVFVRSTKSGKVQKIVRELYLRQDIPCSSKLCSLCPSIAPSDANGNSESFPESTDQTDC